MAYSRNDLIILVRATLKLYYGAAREALGAMRQNWWAAFAPLIYIALTALLTLPLQMLGIAGSLIMSLVLVLFVSHYFALVRAAMIGDKLTIRESLYVARDLFLPVLNVSFALFVVELVIHSVASAFGSTLPRILLNLALLTVLNALPEVTYRIGGNFVECFQESFQFFKENSVEWLLPFVVVLLPLLIIAPNYFLLFISQIHSLSLPSPSALITSIVCMILSFYIMVFRGILFDALSDSNRRKRIFTEKF